MSVKSEQSKLNSKIDSAKLLIQSFADNKKLDLNSVGSTYLDTNALKKKLLGDGSGKSVNTDFLGKLVDTLMQSSGGGPDKVKTFVKKIIKKVSNESPKITKIVMEELFRSINCETDFSLKDIKIVLTPSEIDFFDLLKVAPDGMPGRIMYEKGDIDSTNFPLPLNKILQDITVSNITSDNNIDLNTAKTVTSSNGKDLFKINFNDFSQEYVLQFEDINVTDFVSHYYSSFELFNSKELMSDLIDQLFGVVSFDVSTKRVKSFAELNKMMQILASLCSDFYEQDALLQESLIDRLSPEDEDLSYEFDDEDTRYVEEEFNYKINKIYKLVDCGNFEAEMNTDLLIDALLDLDSDNINDSDVIEGLLQNIGSGFVNQSGFDIPTINLNLNLDIFKQIPKTIMSKVMGPKTILPFIVLTKAIDSAKESANDVKSFVNNNNRFVTRVGKRVFDMYKKELFDEIKRELTKLATMIIKQLAKQQIRGRYAIILALLSILYKVLTTSDFSTCTGIIKALLSLLNLKTGLPSTIPFPLLYAGYAREGANSSRAYNNAIEFMGKQGVNMSSLPDGTPNKHILMIDSVMKGMMKELGENGVNQFVSLPATGAHPLGPVVTPFVTGKSIPLTSF